ASCLEQLVAEAGSYASAIFELVTQPAPLGSGDAARAALPALTDGLVLVLNGDAPLVEAEQLRLLVSSVRGEACEVALLSCDLDVPHGYGRVLRNARGEVFDIREEKDLQGEERLVREVNAGIYCATSEFLKTCLPCLSDDNAAREFYITDLVEMAARGRGAI